MARAAVGIVLGGSFALLGASAAHPAADQASCQERADKVARAIGTPVSRIEEGRFFIRRAKVATAGGECGDGSFWVQPDPESYEGPLSPAYPALAVRATAAAFALDPAEVTRAVSSCLEAAVSDPPKKSGRAGFARQRWLGSRMTGSAVSSGLAFECTYHNADKRAATLTIRKAE